MKTHKLNYRFHNPNTPEKTADYLLKIFLETNQEKVENAIKQADAKSVSPIKIKKKIAEQSEIQK